VDKVVPEEDYDYIKVTAKYDVEVVKRRRRLQSTYPKGS